jgi:SAM-dependent methyltransferase
MDNIKALERAIASIATLHTAEPSLDQAAVVLRLRKQLPQFDRDTLALAIDTYFSRRAAAEKLGSWATRGYFSADLLEQASRQAISRYRAEFFRGLHHVLELGTGTGADTAALAQVATRVTSIEVDPTRAELARENLRVQGIDNITVLVGDVVEAVSHLNPADYDGLFADPARRTREGSRVRQAHDYSPPLEFLLSLPIGRVRAIKVSPGLFFHPPTPSWKRHFIGVRDECLEQTILYGVPIPDSSVHLADSMMSWAPGDITSPIPPSPTEISGYISEAHALINRSQYLASFFGERGIVPIAPDVAYGISQDAPSPTPLLQSFRIIDAFPCTVARLRQALQNLKWTNRTELKKRNCSLELDAVRASLRLPPHTHNAPFGTVFLFTWRGTHHVVLGERLGE